MLRETRCVAVENTLKPRVNLNGNGNKTEEHHGKHKALHFLKEQDLPSKYT